MMMLRTALLFVAASAFTPSSMNARWSALLYSSGDYLSSLAGNAPATTIPSSSSIAAPPPAPATPETSTHQTTYTPPVVVETVTTTYPLGANKNGVSIPALENGGTESFSYASRSFFDVEYLTPKGPRANADVGQPHDATRELVDLGATSAGSWWCAEGGWPSLKQRATTEVFYVISGHGCLTDMDEARHFFGPGDTVVLPKGWAGRWDIQEAIHKVWCVHDHPRIEERDNIIRAVVIPHHKLASAEVLHKHGVRTDAVHGAPSTASQVVYNVGPTMVGCWSCSPGSFPIDGLTNTQFFHVLEGVFFVTNPDGSARRCVAGDTVVLPKGWSGMFDVVDTVRKLNVVIEG